MISHKWNDNSQMEQQIVVHAAWPLAWLVYVMWNMKECGGVSENYSNKAQKNHPKQREDKRPWIVKSHYD
jgi:hypothetical protein